jgi:ribose 5-phosphate isomerase B
VAVLLLFYQKMQKTIAIGADHAGFEYKKPIINFLEQNGYTVVDFGAYSDNSVDYPDFAHPVALAVENLQAAYGILLCGSGQGVSITANKHQGIRAALAWRPDIAALAVEHNNANVLCMPVRFISLTDALASVSAFLNAAFAAGRHASRVAKISC